MVNIISDIYNDDEMKERAFYRIAWNIHHMWEETGSSDSRLFMEPIVPDQFVVVGQSINGTDRREHVVPRVMLCNECHKMYNEAYSIEHVGNFISRYLKIILISKTEQAYLDKTLQLKTTMPDGWSFEDGDPFARLKEANIQYNLYD